MENKKLENNAAGACMLTALVFQSRKQLLFIATKQ